MDSLITHSPTLGSFGTTYQADSLQPAKIRSNPKGIRDFREVPACTNRDAASVFTGANLSSEMQKFRVENGKRETFCLELRDVACDT